MAYTGKGHSMTCLRRHREEVEL